MPIPPKRKGRLDWLPQSVRTRIFEWKSLARVEGSYVQGALRLLARWMRPRATILFYPELPKPNSVAFFVSSVLGYRLTRDLRDRVDGAVRYHDATTSDVGIPPEVPLSQVPVNQACRDIRKSHVQEVFERVFGYPLAVDPLTYAGEMIEKADRNATKDVRVVHGPLASDQVRPGYVYERKIDGRVAPGWIVEYRIPVIGGSIPAVSVRWRPEDAPLIARASDSDQVEASDVFSADEIERVIVFARELGMDFGAIDAFRDAHDGRLYLLDANNTPNGPGSRVSDEVYRWTILRYAEAFEATVLPPARRPHRPDRRVPKPEPSHPLPARPS